MNDPDDATDAEAIRALALSHPGVAALAAGAFGEVAVYFAGRRVPGLRIDAERVELHVIAHYGIALPDLAGELGQLLAPALAGRRLQVVVTDVVLPGETLESHAAIEAGTDA